MNGLSLFSGIGGIDVALSDYVRPIAYCEIDPYCQGVLLSRIADGILANAAIWDDIKSLSGQQFKGVIDIIYGGFPCQDISVAGNGAGLAGERSGLFYEMLRLVKEIKPKFVFLENVGGLRRRGLDRIIKEFNEARYDVRWTMLRASDVGVIHRRERIFILAYLRSERIQGMSEKQIQRKPTISRIEDERRFKELRDRSNLFTPKLCGSGNGIRSRMERTHALGNAVVPAQARKAFEILIGLRNEI